MLYMISSFSQTAIVDAESLDEARRKMFTFTEDPYWLQYKGWEMDTEGIVLLESKGVHLLNAWYDRRYM